MGIKNRLKKAKIKNAINGWLMLIPATIFIGGFLYYPVIESFRLSLHRWDGITTESFIGIENYIRLFTNDPVFFDAVKRTFMYSAITVTGIVGMGFFLALIIERRVKGWSIYKVIWFLPVVLPQTIVGVLWTRFYEPISGLINVVLTKIGLEQLSQSWLGNPDIAIFSTIAVAVWQWSGWAMILLLVALENIDVQVQEAATIDGVNLPQRIRYIMLPLIKPVLVVVIMLMIIGTLKSFDLIYVLTAGGPGNSTTVLSILLYNTAFRFYRYGYGSSIAVVMFVLIFTISILYQKLFMKDD